MARIRLISGKFSTGIVDKPMRAASNAERRIFNSPRNSTFAAAAWLRCASNVAACWRDTAKAVFNNWLGKIYQLTDQDRRLPFMEGIDPDNPLGL